MYEHIAHIDVALTVQDRCRLAGVPRSSYYRQHDREKIQPNGVVQEVRKICGEYPRYGYRRVTKELVRRGAQANHKRVLTLMRKENLLCRIKRRFVHTTDSRHDLPIYPNVARSLVVTRPNELWVADITYVRLLHGFAYLAVILDAFSRRAIGWAISMHIDTKLSLAALTMALETRSLLPGLVHHSDRGVQYASSDYVTLLKSKNIVISMSRKGNPYDNAKAESFMKTLKSEEVSLNDYESFSDAKQNIEHFISLVYNYKRLHSSLGYQTPVEFEAHYINRSILSQQNYVSV
jgi:transposase InsO family protein